MSELVNVDEMKDVPQDLKNYIKELNRTIFNQRYTIQQLEDQVKSLDKRLFTAESKERMLFDLVKEALTGAREY